jgi:hypothetical protein
MEEQVNKLIEKIENDSLSHYDFNEVLDMLKDLLVSNKQKTAQPYCWEEDACGSNRRCENQCGSCKALNS